jgi:transcriptional regulator with XRE-family HTH domain
MARPARTTAAPPPAADLVRAWLEANGRTQKWLAGALGVTLPAVEGWLAGKHGPALETAVVLERLTDGDVPVDAWADPSMVESRVAHASAHESSHS